MRIIWKAVLAYAVFCSLWLDKSGAAEWVCQKLHMEKHRKELSETVVIDKRCEGYKTLCLANVFLSFLLPYRILCLLLASLMFLLAFIRWMMHAETMPFLDQKGIQKNERVPLLSMIFVLAIGYALQYTENSHLESLFWIAVSVFILVITVVYAIAASKEERKIAFNYVICIVLFGFLGFGVVCTANRCLKTEIVEQKQVVIQDIRTSARLASSIVIEEEDSLLGIEQIYISSSELSKYEAGQSITIVEVKGMLGMRWVRIKEE